MADDNTSERNVNIESTVNVGTANDSPVSGTKVSVGSAREVNIHGVTTPPPSFRSVVLVGVLAFLGAVLINIATIALIDSVFIGLSLWLEGGWLDVLFGFPFGVVVSVFTGGLAVTLIGKPDLRPRQVILVETLRWSWWSARRSMLSGLLVGMLLGGVISLSGRLVAILSDIVYSLMLNSLPANTLGELELQLVAIIGVRADLESAMRNLEGRTIFGSVIAFGLAGALIGGISGALDKGVVPTRVTPNQGIWRSARKAVLSGLIFGTISGLTFGIGNGWIFDLGTGKNLLEMNLIISGAFGFGLSMGLLVGCIGALTYGGYACLSHLALRLILFQAGSIPWNYARFLDYCAERIFLRKVGGGYIFVHRLLMEHFASLNTDQPAAPPK